MPLPFSRIPTSSTADSKCQLARPALTNCLLPPNPHAFLGPPKKQKSFKLSCLVQFPQEHCTPQADSSHKNTIKSSTIKSHFHDHLKQPRDPILRRHFGPIRPPKKDLGEAFSYSLIRIGSRGSVSRMLRATKKKPKNIC